MTSHDQPTSLFTALVLVFDCAGLEGADGCDDEDGSCSGLNFNSFNSTLSLLSSEERLEGVATTDSTPPVRPTLGYPPSPEPSESSESHTWGQALQSSHHHIGQAPVSLKRSKLLGELAVNPL